MSIRRERKQERARESERERERARESEREKRDRETGRERERETSEVLEFAVEPEVHVDHRNTFQRVEAAKREHISRVSGLLPGR
jgi:hypothetical protein